MSINYSRNPIHNVIDGQIKGGIRLCVEHEYYGSALKLIYSGIDVMAFLSMPKERQTVKKHHFVKWAEEYIKFPGDEQLSGKEMHAARSELLHTHRAKSDVSPKARGRFIMYVDQNEIPIKYDPNVNERLVMVSISHFMQAFFEGIDRFLIDAYQNTDKAEIIEKRFESMLHMLPYNKQNETVDE